MFLQMYMHTNWGYLFINQQPNKREREISIQKWVCTHISITKENEWVFGTVGYTVYAGFSHMNTFHRNHEKNNYITSAFFVHSGQKLLVGLAWPGLAKLPATFALSFMNKDVVQRIKSFQIQGTGKCRD